MLSRLPYSAAQQPVQCRLQALVGSSRMAHGMLHWYFSRDFCWTGQAKMDALTPNDEVNAFFAAVNHHVLRDVVLERRYFENLSTEKLLSHLQGPLTREIMERSNITRDLTPLQVQTSVTFLLGGMLAVCRSWLLTEQNTPLEEIGALVNDLVQNGFRRS